jgi:hypothetical protein
MAGHFTARQSPDAECAPGEDAVTRKTLCKTYGAASDTFTGKGETMLGQDIIVAPTQSRPPALIDGSGRKARDRIEHFLRAAIDNDNTRRAYGRALGSFFAFLEDGGKQRIQDIGPLDVRDYLEAAKANGLSTATLKQHMAAIRMLFNHMVTGAVLEHNPALSVKAPKLGKGKTPVLTAEEAGAAAPRSPPTWRTRHAGEGAAIAAHASTRTPQLYDRR